MNFIVPEGRTLQASEMRLPTSDSSGHSSSARSASPCARDARSETRSAIPIVPRCSSPGQRPRSCGRARTRSAGDSAAAFRTSRASRSSASRPTRAPMLDDAQPLMVYVPYWWRTRSSTSLLIRTKVDPVAILGPVRRAVQQIDPRLPSASPGRSNSSSKHRSPDAGIRRNSSWRSNSRRDLHRHGRRLRCRVVRRLTPARDEHQDCARRSNVARRRLAAAAGHGAGRCRRRGRSSGCARGWRDRGSLLFEVRAHDQPS